MSLWDTPELRCWKINHPTQHPEFYSLNCEDYYVLLSGYNNDWGSWQSMYSLCVPVPEDHAQYANRRCQYAFQDNVTLGGWASTGVTMYNNEGVAQCP